MEPNYSRVGVTKVVSVLGRVEVLKTVSFEALLSSETGLGE